MITWDGKEEVNARDIPKIAFAYLDWLVVGGGVEGKEDDND